MCPTVLPTATPAAVEAIYPTNNLSVNVPPQYNVSVGWMEGWTDDHLTEQAWGLTLCSGCWRMGLCSCRHRGSGGASGDRGGGSQASLLLGRRGRTTGGCRSGTGRTSRTATACHFGPGFSLDPESVVVVGLGGVLMGGLRA